MTYTTQKQVRAGDAVKCWNVYCMVDGRWREAHHGIEFLNACGLANWYQSLYGGQWCANSDRRRLITPALAAGIWH